jgi:GTP cyclohydrolase I
VEEVADETRKVVRSQDVVVVGRGRHLCLEARGAKMWATAIKLSACGAFRQRPSLRAEFLAFAGDKNSLLPETPRPLPGSSPGRK